MNVIYCTEEGCDGRVGILWPVSVEIEPDGACLIAYPCEKCGRLFQNNGEPLCDMDGNKAYYRTKDNTCIVLSAPYVVVRIFSVCAVALPEARPSTSVICR
jgi:hypothetical protein